MPSGKGVTEVLVKLGDGSVVTIAAEPSAGLQAVYFDVAAAIAAGIQMGSSTPAGITARRPIGTYVNFESQVTGTGIRRYPYTTDMAVNPFTYADVADPVNPAPHGIGSIWATMLWDMYWNLVDVMGYDPDVYHGTGGNNVAFQLVTDGLKLQVCSPGFVDGRNAILAADAADYEGENTCDIWRAFARRGLGLNASQGSSNNRNDGVEDFTLPPACVDLIFADGFGMGDSRRWSSTAP